MAQSSLGHPQAIMSEIRRVYDISDEEEILAFLERHPEVAPLLHETRGKIRLYFGEDPVRLDIFYDPEWPEDGPKLVVNIQTHFASHEALDRLHQFVNAWWTKKRKDIDAPLMVSFEHTRRV
jgi:hypothetical protein